MRRRRNRAEIVRQTVLPHLLAILLALTLAVVVVAVSRGELRLTTKETTTNGR